MADESVAQDQLRAFIERIERLSEEKQAIADDIKEIYAEAKGNGFSPAVLREVVKIRKMDHSERMEKEAILELYLSALGMSFAPKDDDDDPTPRGRQSQPAYQAEAAGLRREEISAGASMAGSFRAQTAAEEIIDPLTGEITEVPYQPAPLASAQGEAGVRAASPVQSLPDMQPITQFEDDASPAPPQPVESTYKPAACLDPDKYAAQKFEPRPSGAAVDGGDTCDVEGTSPPFGGVAADPGKSGGEKSSPAPSVTGEVRHETCPPEPVRWHEFANCFPPVLGVNLAALEANIHATFGGVQKPIVKIGHFILDGRARYGISRAMRIPYPVVEYAGTDPLADVIQWNLEARDLSASERKAIAAKLIKLPSVAHRASEIAALLSVEWEIAA